MGVELMNTTTGYSQGYRQTSKLITKTRLPRLFKPDCLSILPEINFNHQMKFLDVGCGNGRLLLYLAAYLHDYEFHGVDIDPKKISKNQKQNKFSNVRFHCTSADKLPFDNEYFDIITCTNAITDFPLKVRALDEMYRVLKPGGQLYILQSIINKNWKSKFDKTLRQSKFIQPRKKILPNTVLFRKSYFIKYTK